MPIFDYPLKVSTPENKRIIAKVEQNGSQINIKIGYLEAVKKDKPPFAKNGVINFEVTRDTFKDGIKILTKYLEDLFLKELAKNESKHSSPKLSAKPGRAKADDTAGDSGSSEKQRDAAGIYISP